MLKTPKILALSKELKIRVKKGTFLVPAEGVLIFYTIRYIIRVCRGNLNYPYWNVYVVAILGILRGQ